MAAAIRSGADHCATECFQKHEDVFFLAFVSVAAEPAWITDATDMHSYRVPTLSAYRFSRKGEKDTTVAAIRSKRSGAYS